MRWNCIRSVCSVYSSVAGGEQRILDLNKKKAAEKNPNILRQLKIHITATDRQIDRLVYELYGLTEQVIAIVEGKE